MYMPIFGCKGIMSNYIYNDNFEDQGPEHINVIYTGQQKKRTPVTLIVCTVLIVFSGLMFLAGGVFNFVASKVAKNNVPVIQINNGSESNADTDASMLSSSGSLTGTIKNVKDSVVEIKSVANGAGLGSGVIVGGPPEGISYGERCYYIMTNAHVVQGEYTNMYIPVKVVLTDGTAYATELCEFDAKSDIAILKIKEPNKTLCVATWANSKSELQLGEQVVAIGNPLGELGGTVTVGHLSALSREISVSGNKMKLLQFDAAVNRGNSGGGLFNAKGELIGIVNAKIVDTEVEGIGFAIPYTEAYDIFIELVQYGYVKGRPTIGASFVTDKNKIVVYETDSKSALQVGDIIKEIKVNENEGFVTVTAQSLQEILNNMEIDDSFELKIQRGYREIIIKITVYEYSK